MPPGGGPGAEPAVEIVLGAVTQVPSAVGQPGQERDRHGDALLGPLVGAVAERCPGGAAGPQVAQQAPAEESFEHLTVPGIADRVELGGGPALEVGQAPVAGRQHTVPDQQRAQVFDGAVRPEGIQGGVAAGHAVTGQVPQGLAVIALRRSHATPLCGRCIDTSPPASGRSWAGISPLGPARASVTSSVRTHHQHRPRSPAVTSRPQPQRKRAGMPLQPVQVGCPAASRPGSEVRAPQLAQLPVRSRARR